MSTRHIAIAAAAALSWSVPAFAIPLATTQVSKNCSITDFGGGTDQFQSGAQPFDQLAGCSLSGGGSTASGNAFAGVGSIETRVGIASATATIASANGTVEANLLSSVQYHFEIKPVGAGPPNPPALLPVLFSAHGVGSVLREGYGISRAQGVAHLFGDPLPTGAALQSFDISVVDETAFDGNDRESLGASFGPAPLALDLYPNYTYTVVLSAACSTWIAPVGGQSDGASASCSVMVDPVLTFDQEALDARMGAGTFALAENYAFAFSENVTTPIPEPETWAMMLAGLLTTGWAARRRALRRPG